MNEVDEIEKAIIAMTTGLHKLQNHSPGMDEGALNLSLGIAIRMEKAANDLKGAATLLRESSTNWMAHHSTEGR